MTLVGDGDSKVLNTLHQNVPIWGPYIQKIECANHICKNIRSKLEHLVAEKLELDILNCVYHTFGHHDRCSPDFCRATQGRETDDNKEEATPINGSDATTMDAFLEMQAEAWRTEKGDMELARLDQPAGKVDMLPEMFKDIQQIMATYAGKASQLISNSSTNLAECWMNIRQKFDGGKQVFRGKRGSFNHRSTGSSLRFMFGPQWSPQVWELCTNKHASNIFNYRYLERQVRYEASNKSKGQAKMKNIWRHRRYARTGESKTKDAI